MIKQQQGAGKYFYIAGFLLLFYVMLSVNEGLFAVKYYGRIYINE